MIRPFALHRPDSVEAASRLIVDLGSAALYCGGTELLQVMKLGLAHFEHLVDVKGIAELHGVAADEPDPLGPRQSSGLAGPRGDGGLRIGAGGQERIAEAAPRLLPRAPRCR